MTINVTSRLQEVKGITNEQKIRVQDFLQGAIYSWCKNRPNEWFSLRDLVGGENSNWKNTPLMSLYLKHHPDPNAATSAGKDCGWLLKQVIATDSRIFETRKAGLVRQYRWLQTQK